jgi:hypothetical protein
MELGLWFRRRPGENDPDKSIQSAIAARSES